MRSYNAKNKYFFDWWRLEDVVCGGGGVGGGGRAFVGLLIPIRL